MDDGKDLIFIVETKTGWLGRIYQRVIGMLMPEGPKAFFMAPVFPGQGAGGAGRGLALLQYGSVDHVANQAAVM